MVEANPILGIFLHSIGAMAAAFCYTPQQKLRGWSWQTYWISQAMICWLVLPIVGAAVTIPHLRQVLCEAPPHAMIITFVLGAIYGVGGAAFGLAIRHIGYSLTYAIAIGISCVVGTLAGPMMSGSLGTVLLKPGSTWVMAGVGIGVIGTLISGAAGRLKEIEFRNDAAPPRPNTGTFSLAKGLALCVLAGVLSAVYGIAINDTGKPIADAAAAHGAGYWQTNVVYLFANTGAFVSTLLYCLWLIGREKTAKEFVAPRDRPAWALPLNYLLAVLTGCLWYSQFLFYGLAHVRMGQFKFSSWGIHMIQLILFSALAGVIMKEWVNTRPRTKAAITLAVAVLVGAVLMLAYGNYVGEVAATATR